MLHITMKCPRCGSRNTNISKKGFLSPDGEECVCWSCWYTWHSLEEEGEYGDIRTTVHKYHYKKQPWTRAKREKQRRYRKRRKIRDLKEQIEWCFQQMTLLRDNPTLAREYGEKANELGEKLREEEKRQGIAPKEGEGKITPAEDEIKKAAKKFLGSRNNNTDKNSDS